MKSVTALKDHVCGMHIQTATAAGRTESKANTYLQPEQYLCNSERTSKGSHCRCS
jgi:YHS domain-containing protein